MENWSHNGQFAKKLEKKSFYLFALYCRLNICPNVLSFGYVLTFMSVKNGAAKLDIQSFIRLLGTLIHFLLYRLLISASSPIDVWNSEWRKKVVNLLNSYVTIISYLAYQLIKTYTFHVQINLTQIHTLIHHQTVFMLLRQFSVYNIFIIFCYIHSLFRCKVSMPLEWNNIENWLCCCEQVNY